jgi:hypothetical protein
MKGVGIGNPPFCPTAPKPLQKKKKQQLSVEVAVLDPTWCSGASPIMPGVRLMHSSIEEDLQGISL